MLLPKMEATPSVITVGNWTVFWFKTCLLFHYAYVVFSWGDQALYLIQRNLENYDQCLSSLTCKQWAKLQ